MRIKILVCLALLAVAAPVTAAGIPFVLSRTSDGTTGVLVDDDLDVYLNGALIYSDGTAGAGVRPRIRFVADPGGTLRFVVRDTYGFCSSLSPVYLTNEATGQNVLADPGFNIPCDPLRVGDLGIVHDLTFAIPGFSPRPETIVADGFSDSVFHLVFQVDPVTHARSVLSSFTDPSQGPTGSIQGLAAGACGAVFVLEGGSSGRVFQVLPDGKRIVKSNPADGNPTWYSPFSIGVDTDGGALVTDRGQGGGGNRSALWKVAADGFRSHLYYYGDLANGHPEGVALDAAGNVLIGDAEGGTDCHTFGGCGGLYRVDRAAGTIALVSDFGNPLQGPLGEDGGRGVALDTDGSILVTDPFAPAALGEGVLFRVDAGGSRQQLTYWTFLENRIWGVAVLQDGTILVPNCGSTGSICSVDRATGARPMFSDFRDSAQGPTGYTRGDIAVVRGGAPPAGQSQSLVTIQNTSLPITLTGTSNPTGTFTIVASPAHGTLSGVAPSLTYDPAPGYIGADQFKFAIENACGGSGPASVFISVGAPPLPASEPAAGGGLVAAKGAGGSVNIAWPPACFATNHAVYWGSGPITGAPVWTGAQCAVGTTGVSSFDPGNPPAGGLVYFVVVGQTPSSEGSYGKSSSGVERPESVGVGACDLPQEVGAACGP